MNRVKRVVAEGSKRGFKMKSLRLFLLAHSAVTAYPVLAEDIAEADDAARPEIVVNGHRAADDTGSKTGTPVRDIPASIVTVPEKVLDDQAVLDLNEAVRNVSGVQPVYAGGYGFADNYVIRGLRMKFLRDGVADGPSMVGYARSFADVESVTVLKGPGSAIYGRAEPGGVINIVTKQPQFATAANASLTAGSRDTYSVQADVTGPISGELAVRATGEYTTTEGFRGLSRRTAAGSLGVLWRVAEGQTLTAKLDLQDQHFVVDNFGIPVDPSTRLLYAVDPSTRYYTPDNFVDQQITRLTLQWIGEITPALSVRATYRFDDRNLDFRRNAGFNYTATGIIGSRTQREHRDRVRFQVAQVEATLASDIGGIEGKTLLGAEIEWNRFDVRRVEYTFTGQLDPLSPVPEASAAGLTGKLIFDRDISSDTVSAYVQHEAAVGDWLKLRAGFRRDWVDAGDMGLSTSRPVAGQAGPFTLLFSQKLDSWQIGGVVQPTSSLSFYAGHSKGEFLNIQSESNILTTPPESSRQTEIGVKLDVIPGKLNVNVAAFEVKRRNYLVTLVPGGTAEPVGAQDGKGLEIDVAGEVLPGVNVVANYAWLDAEIVKGEIATTFAGTPWAVTGSILGKEPQSTPRHSASFWASWDLPGALEGFGIGAGVNYKGRSFADSQNVIRTPGYTIGNAAVYWRSERFDAAINVKNVTNEDYYVNPTFTGSLPGDPRTVLLTLTARY